jgi:hypothetical protein
MPQPFFDSGTTQICIDSALPDSVLHLRPSLTTYADLAAGAKYKPGALLRNGIKTTTDDWPTRYRQSPTPRRPTKIRLDLPACLESSAGRTLSVTHGKVWRTSRGKCLRKKHKKQARKYDLKTALSALNTLDKIFFAARLRADCQTIPLLL